MQKLGFNVHRVDQRLIGMLQSHPGTVVTLVAPGRDDMINGALTILDQAPQTTIVYRIWRLPSGQRMDQGTPVAAVSHQDWIDAYAPVVSALGADRIFVDTWNEANTIENNEEYFRWHAEAERIANRMGWRLCHANFSTGTPDIPHYDTPAALDFYRALAGRGWKSIIGIHEYVPVGSNWQNGENWHIGRYRRMTKAMQANGVPTTNGHGLRYAITELGNEGILKAIRESGWNAYGQAQEIISMHRQVFDPDPYVIGTCWYCWGDWGGWRDHDLSSPEAAPIFNRVEAAWVPRSGQPQQPPTQEEPPVSVCDQPIPDINTSEAGTRWECRIEKLNVRPYPAAAACAKPVGSLAEGDIVKIKGTVFVNDYVWLVIDTGSETDLYVARGTDSESWMEQVDETPPSPDDYAIVYMTNDVAALAVIQYLATYSGGAVKLSQELYNAVQNASAASKN